MAWGNQSVVLRWVLATALGFGAAIAGGSALTWMAERFPGVNPDRFWVFAILCCLGLTVGWLQWRVMGRLLPDAVHWIGATTVGYLLVLLTVFLPPFPDASQGALLDDALRLSLVGALIGLAQWWALRQRCRGSAWWIPASAVGFLCFLWIVANPAHSLVEFVWVGGLLGGLAAVAPGVVLARLIHQLHTTTT